MIEHFGNGGTMITGNSINFFRMITIANGLRVEARGMKLTRGVSCYAIAKREYGLKGNLAKVTEQFNALLEAERAKQVHVTKD